MTVGFMDKMRSVVGGVSPELLANGTLARGEVLSVKMTGMSVSRGDQVATEKQVSARALPGPGRQQRGKDRARRR